MLHRAGAGILVQFDDENQLLRVFIDTALISGFIGRPREVGAFGNYEEWSQSSYCAQVTDVKVLEMIDWFWIDLEEAPR